MKDNYYHIWYFMIILLLIEWGYNRPVVRDKASMDKQVKKLEIKYKAQADSLQKYVDDNTPTIKGYTANYGEDSN